MRFHEGSVHTKHKVGFPYPMNVFATASGHQTTFAHVCYMGRTLSRGLCPALGCAMARKRFSSTQAQLQNCVRQESTSAAPIACSVVVWKSPWPEGRQRGMQYTCWAVGGWFGVVFELMPLHLVHTQGPGFRRLEIPGPIFKPFYFSVKPLKQMGDSRAPECSVA